MARQLTLSASILNANFAALGQDVFDVTAAGVGGIHFDVMDHHYVPNLSFGAHVCDSLRQAGVTVPIDVHLMVTNPEHYIEPFAKAGADVITFHPETVSDVNATVAMIQNHNMKAGLAFNPDQAVEISAELVLQLEMILLMSVFPGFGGQSFIESVYQKISTTRHWLDQHQCQTRLAVDGGVKRENLRRISQAGADFFVIGSGLFAADDYQMRVSELFSELA